MPHMDRFTRFKLLRALWARARALLAWLHVPQQQQLRYRAQYWQQIQVAERHIRDGIVRSSGDPDSYVRPLDRSPGQAQTAERGGQQAQAWQAQWEAQRQWFEAHERAERQPRRR
jgi:hypothetical protein